MGRINWSSAIADADGEIDVRKLGQVAAIVLALGGGVVLILAMAGAITPGDYMALGVSTLVLPLTGIGFGQAVAGKLRSKKILKGELPGRRDTDTHPVVPGK